MGELKTYEVPIDICISVLVSSQDPEDVTRKALAAIHHIEVDHTLAVGSKIRSLEFAGDPVEYHGK